MNLLILLILTLFFSPFEGRLFIIVTTLTLFSVLNSILEVNAKATLDAANHFHILCISRCTSLQFTKLRPVVVLIFCTFALSLMHENHKHWKALSTLIAYSVQQVFLVCIGICYIV